MLQINVGGGGLRNPHLYSVNRDLAHCTADLVRTTVKRFKDGVWPELQTLCLAHGIGPNELGHALEAFAKALGDHTDRREQFVETLNRHGWLAVPPIAQIAVMAMWGATVFGASYASIREATLNRVGPAMSSQDLAARAAEVHKVMAAGSRTHITGR